MKKMLTEVFLFEGLKLKPEQEALASKFAGKLMQMALKEAEYSMEDWKEVVRQIIVASEQAEGEDAGEVEA